MNSLTVEHVVPRSMGGDAVVLSCRQCNNSQGSVLEGELAKLNRYAGFWQGRNPLRVNLLIGDQRAAATARRGASGSGLHLDVIGRASDPVQVKKMQEAGAQGRVSEIRLQQERRAEMLSAHFALVRSAYLCLFRCFGYHYTHDHFVQKIRAAIRYYAWRASRTSPPTGITGDLRKLPRLLLITLTDVKRQPDWPYWVMQGEASMKGPRHHASFFLVGFRCLRARGEQFAVFMPQPGEDAEAFLAFLRSATEQDCGMRASENQEVRVFR